MTSYAASFAGHRSSSLPFHGYATRKPSLITLVSRRRAVVAAVSNGSPEGPGSVPRQPLFSDSITAKNASKPRDVHASSQNDSLLASEPAPASLLGSVTWQGSKDFDRLLNLGALSAGAALILATALNAGPDPWQAYQDSVALNPIETKVCCYLPSSTFILAETHLLANGCACLMHCILLCAGLYLWDSIQPGRPDCPDI